MSIPIDKVSKIVRQVGKKADTVDGKIDNQSVNVDEIQDKAITVTIPMLQIDIKTDATDEKIDRKSAIDETKNKASSQIDKFTETADSEVGNKLVNVDKAIIKANLENFDSFDKLNLNLNPICKNFDKFDTGKFCNFNDNVAKLSVLQSTDHNNAISNRDPRLFVPLMIRDHKIWAFIDSGSTRTHFGKDMIPRLSDVLLPCNATVIVANNGI